MIERRTNDATLIEAVRILSRTIHTEDGVIPACLAEAATRLEELVEERRWIPVGERLPDDGDCVEAAGSWGVDLVWWDDEEWCDEFSEPLHIVVTHWRKPLPGPEVKA